MNRNAETVRESGFYSSKKWINLRNAIRERDMMTCQKCGDYQAERYEVDHITELNWQNVDDWEVAYNPDNLQLLCHECHVRKTREYQKNGKRLFYQRRHMGIYQNIVKIFRGRIDKKTQRVSWQNATTNFTSNFILNIQHRIANEISKSYFNHVEYTVNSKGYDFSRILTGTDIDEVLNWAPKEHYNTVEFWNDVVVKMLNNKYVHLKPIFDSKGTFISLIIVGDEEYKLDETVNLVSPFYSDNGTSLLDSILTSVYEKLATNKTRAFLKINGNFAAGEEKFRKQVSDTLKAFQEVGEYNGIGVLDAKTDIFELKNSYSVITQEEMDFIKSEILSGYGISEKVLLGTATEEENTAFRANTIAVLLEQLERELTYKLISSYKRIRREGKQTYQRIVVNTNIMKFASLDQLIKFSQVNTNTPIVQQNEERGFYGLAPIEGGDEFFVNLNSTTAKNVTTTEETNEENN